MAVSRKDPTERGKMSDHATQRKIINATPQQCFDVITDFKVGTDDIGLVYALDLKLKQKGDNLLIRTENGKVHTTLLDVKKDDFLKNLDTDDYTLLPFVEVNVL